MGAFFSSAGALARPVFFSRSSRTLDGSTRSTRRRVRQLLTSTMLSKPPRPSMMRKDLAFCLPSMLRPEASASSPSSSATSMEMFFLER